MPDLSIAYGIASTSFDGGSYGLISCGMLVLALCVAIKAWFHDRSKGRSRCRRCWYPLPEDELRPCPECGCKPRATKDLYRTRRSKRWGMVAILFVMLAGTVWYWPHVQYRRSELGEPFIRAIVPTTYMIWALPYTDQSEWIMLYHRVSGKPAASGLFGTSSNTSLPASITPVLNLNPDPIHIGYAEIDPENPYEPYSLFSGGPYVPEHLVWRWQGRYLMDRLWVVAGDNERAMPDRLGAFYLYTGYCGYTRLEHFERVLPLMRSEQGDAFLEANNLRPHWGPGGLDPDLAVQRLTAVLIEGSDDLIKELNVLEGLAFAGNPALDVITYCWESNDRKLQERGTLLLSELCATVNQALREGNSAYRDQLDAKKFVDVIKRAQTTEKIELGNNAYDAIADLIDLYPLDTRDLRAVTRQEPVYQFLEPDAFFISFTKHFLDWVINDHIDDRLDVDEEASLLQSFYDFGMVYVPRDHDLWWDVLDQTDRLLLETNDDFLHWLALTFYDPLYDPGYRWIPGQLTDEDKHRLRDRLRIILNHCADEDKRYEVESMIRAFVEPQPESSEDQP